MSIETASALSHSLRRSDLFYRNGVRVSRSLRRSDLFVSLRPIAPSQAQVTPTEFEPLNVLVSIDRQLLRSSAMDRHEELSRRNELLWARESLKETAAVPTRTLDAVGDRFDDLQIGSIETGRCFKVDRLLKIVRRRVVAFLSPSLHDFVFG